MTLRNLAALALCAAPLLAADSRIRPEVARLLPPDALAIGSVDIEAARESPMLSGFPLGSWGKNEEFFALIGFDPRRDLDRVTFASAGTPGASEPNLIVLEGKFGAEDGGPGLRALFANVGEHAGVALYEAAPRAGEPPSTFAFLDERTVVAGLQDRVTAAIDRWQSAADLSAVGKAALSQGGADAWASTLDPRKLLGPFVDKVPGGGGPLRAILESMQIASLRGTALGDAIRLDLAFLCGGPDDARSLADAAQTMAAFGALTAQQDRPALAELLSRVRIGQNESETTMSIELTQQQLLDLRNVSLR